MTRTKIVKAILTLCGTGFIKFAPGTFGSMWGLIFFYLNPLNRGHSYFIVIANVFIVFILTFLFSKLIDEYLSTSSEKDPKEVVIDEVIGQYLVCSLCFLNPIILQSTTNYPYIFSAFISFVLFRIFDILKPWPIRYFEKRFQNGFGVMFDDILAALLASAWGIVLGGLYPTFILTF